MHARPLTVAIGVALCVLTWGGRAEARGHARGTHKATQNKRHRVPHSKHSRDREPEQTPPEAAPEAPASAPAAQNDAPVPHHGPTRLDFDDRLIQGQTNRAGAVYLYERKELQVRSMVRLRENFRPEIYDSVYGGD